MKNLLLAAAVAGLAISVTRADLVFYEPFNYVDGQIAVTGTNLDGSTNWLRFSGTGNDAFVKNHHLENSATGGTVSRADDVNRPFCSSSGCSYTNTQMPMFASFTFNCTNLPNAVGTYFALFKDAGTANFVGRVFALVGNGGPNAPTNFTALPGTFRLGIAAASGTASRVFPVDLSTNTDYQVVVTYDPTPGGRFATLWVNPINSADPSVSSLDSVTSSALQNILMSAYAFRQGSSFGNAFFNITNLAVATTFDEAATNVWTTNAVAPIIAQQPKGGTNFVGNDYSLMSVAAGQGLAGLTYQWRKNGFGISNPNGNTNVLTLTSTVAGDSGNYDVVVTAPNTLSVTSAVAALWVTNPPVPPTITLQPTNTQVYFGQSATLAVRATGPGTITYTWTYNNGPITSPNVTGDGTPVLNIANIQAANGTAGTYRCGVSNEFGGLLSSNALLSAVPVPLVTIGYLRTLVDPVFFLPTNTTAIYSATGIVTTFSDMTASPNLQFYMEDGTGGITVFVPGGYPNMPQAGDSVTVTGPLGQFNSLLELNLSASDPSNGFTTNSHNNAVPPGIVLPFNFTNGATAGGVGNAIRLYESALVTFTNIYFPAGFTNGTFSAGGTYLMTNSAGEQFKFFLNAALTNWTGTPIPQFAWQLTGPMSYFLGTTAPDRSAGFEFTASRPDDLITTAPLPIVATAALVGGKPVLSWLAQPYISYSILSAADIAGPYTALRAGLTFNSTAGVFTDTSITTAARFYRVTSP